MPCYLKNFTNDRINVDVDMPKDVFPRINLGRICSVETIRLLKLYDTFEYQESPWRLEDYKYVYQE